MRWRDFAIGPLLAPRSSGGEIRLAVDLRSGTPVALRFFFAAPAALPAMPLPAEPTGNLARVLRAESSAGGAAVASELSLGPTVEHLLLSPQSAPVVAGIVAHALRGLAALHRAGHVHGRVHPGNLVLDVRTRDVRVVDLAAFALLGAAADADPRKAYRAPGAASRAPEPRDDVYAVGRIAEALLRGGPPLGAWAPIFAPDEAAPFLAWMRRCQGLGREPPFTTAAEALEAVEALGAAATQGVARLRPGPWVAIRRRAEKTLGVWKMRGLPARASGADLPDFLSSLRAAALWKALAASAAGAVVLAALFAAPAAPPEAANFPIEGCVDAAKAAVLPATGRPAAGRTAVEVSVPADAVVAVDGCPVEAAGTRLAVAQGPHELRARWKNRVVAETIEGAGPFDVAKMAAPEGKASSADRVAGARKSPSPVSAEPVTAALAAAVKSPPALDPGDPWTAALVPRDAAAVLAVACGPASDPAVRAVLPDDLALVLDGLRAASVRLHAASLACTADLAKKTAAVLAVRKPDAPAPLREAVAALAAIRIAAAERAEAPGPDTDVAAERAVRGALGVADSPMLDAAADEVAADPAVRSCAARLSAPAADVATLADRAVALAAGPFAGAK